jgi:hypothetical protein
MEHWNDGMMELWNDDAMTFTSFPGLMYFLVFRDKLNLPWLPIFISSVNKIGLFLNRICIYYFRIWLTLPNNLKRSLASAGMCL